MMDSDSTSSCSSPDESCTPPDELLSTSDYVVERGICEKKGNGSDCNAPNVEMNDDNCNDGSEGDEDLPVYGPITKEQHEKLYGIPQSGIRKLMPNKLVAVAAVFGGVGAVIAAPVVISAVGFGSAGIGAGTLAAGLMSSTAIANGGAIASTSAVAILQSVGVLGTAISTKLAIAGTGSAITGAVASRFK